MIKYISLKFFEIFNYFMLKFIQNMNLKIFKQIKQKEFRAITKFHIFQALPVIHS